MEQHKLEITLVSAKGLNKVNLITKMDVYAVVSIDGDISYQQFKTPVDKECGRNPTWNFNMKFYINEEAVRLNRLLLVVKLMSERVLGDIKIGEVRVPIRVLLDSLGSVNGKQFGSYEVRKPNGKPKGFISISYQFGGKATNVDEPMTAYPPPNVLATSSYPPPLATVAGDGVYPPPAHKEGVPVPYPPPPVVAGYTPPPQYPGHAYPQQQQAYGGYPLQQPGYGYPAPQGYQPGYGYPAPQGYVYPPPAVVQPPKKNSNLGTGLGVGLIGGALGGMLLGDMVSDAVEYDAGYDAGFGDAATYDAGYDTGFGDGATYDAGFGDAATYDAGYDAGFGDAATYDAGYDTGFGDGATYGAGFGDGATYDAGYNAGFDNAVFDF